MSSRYDAHVEMMKKRLAKAMEEYKGDMPETTLEDLYNYAVYGVPQGGFMETVLSNDLVHSFSKADFWNQQAMFHIAKFIYNELPTSCWGDKEKVAAWIASIRSMREEKDQQEGGPDATKGS